MSSVFAIQKRNHCIKVVLKARVLAAGPVDSVSMAVGTLTKTQVEANTFHQLQNVILLHLSMKT